MSETWLFTTHIHGEQVIKCPCIRDKDLQSQPDSGEMKQCRTNHHKGSHIHHFFFHVSVVSPDQQWDSECEDFSVGILHQFHLHRFTHEINTDKWTSMTWLTEWFHPVLFWYKFILNIWRSLREKRIKKC